MNRLFLIALVLLGSASSQASASDVTGAISLERLVQTRTTAAADDRAGSGAGLVMASLPAQQVRKVRQTTDSGGFHQVIELDGSNMIDVRYRRTMTDSDLPVMAKPTEAGIRAELATQFPGMPMVIVDRPRSNAYGIYGLAAGKSPTGASCLYAWQWKDTSDADDTSNVFDALSVRVSLCRKGVTLDDLATVIDRLHIGATRMAAAPEVARPSTITAARPMPAQRTKLTTMRAAPTRPTAMPASQPPSMLTVDARLASVDPGLDPSLPAAAYQGPGRQLMSQRVSQ